MKLMLLWGSLLLVMGFVVLETAGQLIEERREREIRTLGRAFCRQSKSKPAGRYGFGNPFYPQGRLFSNMAMGR